MRELQIRRQNSTVFAGKHGFITQPDLFRWASWFRKDGCSYEDLARDGYHLLAERLRDGSEKNTVEEVLEKYLRVKLKTHELYSKDMDRSISRRKERSNIQELRRVYNFKNLLSCIRSLTRHNLFLKLFQDTTSYSQDEIDGIRYLWTDYFLNA
ncbi:hypothetical protein RND81_09G143000 [Saponaria officinalis]|uniref:Midasin AAA lid domain-containing protein n=1 Tax=Saponaria officinalis TaxID=3572 RepID=A0AAW1IMF6_SAPOF